MIGGNFITLLLPNTALPALVSAIRRPSATSCTAEWLRISWQRPSSAFAGERGVLRLQQG